MDDNSVLRQLFDPLSFQNNNANTAGKPEYFQPLCNIYPEALYFTVELIKNSVAAGASSVDVILNSEISEDDGKYIHSVTVRDLGDGLDITELQDELLKFPYISNVSGRIKGLLSASVFSHSHELVALKSRKYGKTLTSFTDSEGESVCFEDIENFDGTSVTVFFKHSHADLTGDLKACLKKYCKHIAVPVFFADEDIRESFGIKNAVFENRIEHKDGSVILSAYVCEQNSTLSFYKNGFLLYSVKSPFPYIEIKYESPYFDFFQGLKNSSFYSALKKIKNVEKPLREAYFSELEKLAFSLEDKTGYSGLMSILPCVFLTLKSSSYLNLKILASYPGKPKSVAEFLNAGKTALFGEVSEIAEHALRHGVFILSEAVSEAVLQRLWVIAGGKGEPFFEFLEDKYAVFIETGKLSEVESVFLDSVSFFMRNYGGLPFKSVKIGNLKASVSCTEPFLSLKTGNLIYLPELNGKFGINSDIALLKHHPFIAKLLKISESEPALAAYFFIRAFLLYTNKKPDEDKLLEILSNGVK